MCKSIRRATKMSATLSPWRMPYEALPGIITSLTTKLAYARSGAAPTMPARAEVSKRNDDWRSMYIRPVASREKKSTVPPVISWIAATGSVSYCYRRELHRVPLPFPAAKAQPPPQSWSQLQLRTGHHSGEAHCARTARLSPCCSLPSDTSLCEPTSASHLQFELQLCPEVPG
jgi:hypothetical protein